MEPLGNLLGFCCPVFGSPGDGATNHLPDVVAHHHELQLTWLTQHNAFLAALSF